MASIHAYLQDLEARLAPALDAQALQERLTEAENHLRDRALEFEEVGLPPQEAEARAVAAFGEVEEYVEDVPLATTATPPIRRGPDRDVALQLAVAVLGLGLIATVGINLLPFLWAMLAASLVVGLGALGGRVTPIRRFVAISVVASFALFAVFVTTYVPGRGLLSPMHRDELAARMGLGEGSAAIKYKYFRTQQDEALEDGPFNGASSYRWLAPSSDNGYLKGYASRAEAQRAWRSYGPDAAVNLRNAAEREVGSRFGDAYPSSSILTADAFDAAMLGATLLTLLVGLQALGMAGQLGLGRTRSIRRPNAPPAGSWESR